MDFELHTDISKIQNPLMKIKSFQIRAHTLITLAHTGTYLVRKMLIHVVKIRVLSWSKIGKNVLT